MHVWLAMSLCLWLAMPLCLLMLLINEKTLLNTRSHKFLCLLWRGQYMYIQVKHLGYGVGVEFLYTVKTSFYDHHLLFMTEIPCMDDSVQKSLHGEQLPSECEQRPSNFASTEPLTRNCTWVWDYSRVHMYLVVSLCKLGTTFCVNFEQESCKISVCVYTAASALWLFTLSSRKRKVLTLHPHVLATLISQTTCLLRLVFAS